MARVFVGVGSNIAPEENLRQALRRLAQVVRVKAVSTVYRTAPVGPAGPAPFLNCVVEIETELSPPQLRQRLREIERERGRRRSADKYAPRTIDLDLLLYDDLVIARDGLTVPDPQIAQRAFLARPLYELAPDLVLPDAGRPVAEIADALDNHGLQPLPQYTATLREEVAGESRES